ncbi:hypothetical protein [Bacillus subtilis]|uniref:hypothetical protein n=1 Tax=Bacillus subtilis TaxID=1423 RepID=UPI00077EAE16|nr:hypothetical protein [Bacillus subtilis]AMR46929.1 hypothetical protein KHRBS_10920 [Bacillus subtilis subsp. subtilis]MBG8575278.1 membrane protein [Bacillus subtilis]MBG9627802.1 membrane protein [Bacillus subtilis]MCF7606557.1 hypothetical protein [Bacillus subtilis]MCF7613036.1 hypothetical protein [Bacillus subtilis]
MIVRGEGNAYRKVKNVVDNSSLESMKRNKNLIYLFTLLKGISFIVPLAYIGLIMHDNILMLAWTAVSLIYVVLSMFKVLDVLDGEKTKQNTYIYCLFVCGNFLFVVFYLAGVFL